MQTSRVKETPRRRRNSPAAGEVAALQTAASLELAPVAKSPWGWLAWNGSFVPALASGLLLWAAFPPLGWWLLGWIAPLGWLLLISRKRLPGWRPYLAIWLAGALHWAAVMEGVRLAHPALYLGWLSMSVYLGIYPVLFVGLTRVAVYRLGISVVAAAPIVWTGLELARGYAITGFSMGLLSHTQFRQVVLIQIADLGGAYALSFAMMFVAACLARCLHSLSAIRRSARHERATGESGSTVRLGSTDLTGGPADLPPVADSRAEGRMVRVWWPVAAAGLLLTGLLAYGTWRQRDLDTPDASAATLKVALIQASFDTIFEFNPERERETFARYLELSREAVRDHPDVDVVVWPESVYAGTLGEVLVREPLIRPADVPLPDDEFRDAVKARQIAVDDKNRYVATLLNRLARQNGQQDAAVWLIVGTDSQRLDAGRVERLNTALLIDPDGRVADRYFKMHLVMFGEYIPFGRTLPLLYRLTPMTTGLTPGEQPVAFKTPRAIVAPSICFESTVPHLIRRQVNTLRRSGQAPKVLVTVTNDGWFWGSGVLDLHLACAVFRAVETRLPFLVAANTGLSACIDQNGRIEQQGPRRAEAVLCRPVISVPWTSLYQRWGDIPAGLCLLFCFAVSIVGTADAVRRRKSRKSPE